MTGPGSGSNGSRLAGVPVMDSEPSVRPWKAPSAATTLVRDGLRARPWRRASLSAASLASVPSWQKKTRPSDPTSCRRRSARRIPGSWATRLLVCAIVATCFEHGLDDGRMGVAEAGHGDSCVEVEVFATVGVPDLGCPAPRVSAIGGTP